MGRRVAKHVGGKNGWKSNLKRLDVYWAVCIIRFHSGASFSLCSGPFRSFRRLRLCSGTPPNGQHSLPGQQIESLGSIGMKQKHHGTFQKVDQKL